MRCWSSGKSFFPQPLQKKLSLFSDMPITENRHPCATIIASDWEYITSVIQSGIGGLIQLNRDYNHRFNAVYNQTKPRLWMNDVIN